jgi:hypothetical protein
MSPWTNDYIGIPYLSGGRDRAGSDCWGLVRLVYREQYGIDLPSYGEIDYDAANIAQTAGLIADHRDQWQDVQDPCAGDVVLLRIEGYPAHVGVMIDATRMLHVHRDGLTSCIERLDGGSWRHRIEGYYRHAERLGGVVLSGCPHPLKTVSLVGTLPAGATLRDMILTECRRANVPDVLIEAQGHAWIDGEYIPSADWSTRIPAAGQRVEYRLLPAGGNNRALLTMIVMVAVAVAAPYAAGYINIMAGGAFGAAGSAGAMALGATVSMGLTYAGMALVNAIAPIRPPSVDSSVGRSRYQLQGGANQISPYGAIPVVLGQFRYTPPSGAIPYTESSASENYLRMVLCWGYGPLDVSDLRIGDTPLSSFEDIQIAHLRGVDGENKTAFNRLYGKDVSQESVSVKLETGTPVDRVTSADVDGIKLVFSFPQGLWKTASNGTNAGANVDGVDVGVSIQYRLTGAVDWQEVAATVRAATIGLPPTYDEQTLSKWDGDPDLGDWWYAEYGYLKDNVGDAVQVPLYQWTVVTLDRHNNVVMRQGCITDNPATNPSSTLLALMEAHNYGLPVSYERLPTPPAGEVELYQVCVQGETVVDTVDLRSVSITGCALTVDGLSLSVAAGSIVREDSETLVVSAATKSAFDRVVSLEVPTGQYDVRVTLVTDDSATGTYPSGNSAAVYRECYWSTLTGISNQRPIVPPKPLAMTAIRIRATNQLNGSLEGITGTVKCVCLDYNKATATWITRHTRNPASLFRHVLQHAGNAVPVADAGINLTQLARWHNYCRINGFAFDLVITGQRPMLDVLKDICAAGRASPDLVDGKWTVVIDEPKPNIVQHFTPHNSWGFEGTRILPKRPHALRVQFFNRAKGYQADERMVYDDGYTSANATLIEGIELPGITDADNVHAFGRFHLAQLALRPDTYTLNADMEHLICTRGDKVRVTHDVPMWGLGSGRIRQVLTSGATATGIVVDEVLPMDAGADYSVRIRRKTGTSLVCAIVPAVADGHYSTLMFVTPIATGLINANDLLLYGTTDSESVELVVTGIVPDSQGGARLTLVDYAPGVFNADEEAIPPYDSQISQPPLLMRTVIAGNKVPAVRRVVSDESALSVAGDGSLVSNILVSFGYAANLPKSVTHVELQYGHSAEDMVWDALPLAPLAAGIFVIPAVRDLHAYRFRLRYVDAQGMGGRWSAITEHTVVGKTSVPADVTGLSVGAAGKMLALDWGVVSARDIAGYEVRTADSGWGVDTAWLWRGKASSCTVDPGELDVPRALYVRAFDRGGRYSAASAQVTHTVTAPDRPGALTATFADTALTNATVTLDWPDTESEFGVAYYRASYGAVSKAVKASTITLPADWTGARVFSVQTVDQLGYASAARQLSVTKSAPGKVTQLRAQVIDNSVLLSWVLPAKTTLPIDHVRIRRGDSFATAELVGTKSGSFTSFDELEPGAYTYWATVVDTDNIEGLPVSVAAQVSEPPDFVFHGSIDSTFGGSLSSALLERGAVLMPIDTATSFAAHFTSRGWATPADQIAAGYPLFAQPTPPIAYYEEEFDFGTVLSSSRATVSWGGELIAGTPDISCTLSLSPDGVDWVNYPGVSNAFGTGWRYAKVRITVDQVADDHALYRLSALNVRADAKKRSDSGMVDCVAGDTLGTVYNFGREFIDVTSITATPEGTSPLTPVWSYKDTVIDGTYSITGGVATINAVGHDQVVGQNVRLAFLTGGAPDGIYPVASVGGADSYTVAVAAANTSGTVSTYSQGCRIYLFSDPTTRASARASIDVKGY